MKQDLKTGKKFLVFSAHPDDLDFACSGTIARLTKEGSTIIACIITNGEKGVHKVKQGKRAMVLMREREQKRAAGVIGITEVLFLRHPDGKLENTEAMRKRIVAIIRQVRPDIVMAHDPGNQRFDSFGRFHRDHRMAGETIFDAIYPATASEGFFPELARANNTPHQIGEMWFYGTDRPNFFVDISTTVTAKIEALRAHASQIQDEEGLEKKIRDRAREAGKAKKMPCARGIQDSFVSSEIASV